MNDKGIMLITTIVSAIIGLAIVSVLVSGQAQTGTVLTSAGTAFSSLITAAVSPVTGGSSGVGNLVGNSTGGLLG